MKGAPQNRKCSVTGRHIFGHRWRTSTVGWVRLATHAHGYCCAHWAYRCATHNGHNEHNGHNGCTPATGKESSTGNRAYRVVCGAPCNLTACVASFKPSRAAPDGASWRQGTAYLVLPAWPTRGYRLFGCRGKHPAMQVALAALRVHVPHCFWFAQCSLPVYPPPLSLSLSLSLSHTHTRTLYSLYFYRPFPSSTIPPHIQPATIPPGATREAHKVADTLFAFKLPSEPATFTQELLEKHTRWQAPCLLPSFQF